MALTYMNYYHNTSKIKAHSFWLGDGCEEMHGLIFNYYLHEQITSIVSEYFNIIGTLNYQEFEESDSIFIIAQKVA